MLTVMLVMMKMMHGGGVVEVILSFILLKNQKNCGDFGAGDDFLDPSRVEYIDKRSIFGLDTTTNR